MADDYQVTRPARAPVQRTAPPRSAPRFPDDPDAARREIEATRARMSGTIDEIEGVLIRKKEQLRDRMDVLAPVREEPLKMLGILFGVAFALGFLTGGKDDREEQVRLVYPPDIPRRDEAGRGKEEEEEDSEAELAWEEAEAWEDRAHRLLRVARAQETELEIHRARRNDLLEQLREHRAARFEETDYDEEPSVFDRFRESATEKLSMLAADLSHRMMRGG